MIIIMKLIIMIAIMTLVTTIMENKRNDFNLCINSVNNG